MNLYEIYKSSDQFSDNSIIFLTIQSVCQFLTISSVSQFLAIPLYS